MSSVLGLIKKYWFQVFLAITLVFLVGSAYKQGYERAESECRLSTSEAERIRAEGYHEELTQVIQDIANEQRRANDITSAMLDAQKVVISNSQSLKNEVKNAIKKNQDSGDTCPAFDVDSLQLYKRALGY